MGRRQRILTDIMGYEGVIVKGHWFEREDRSVVEPIGPYDVFAETRLVLELSPRWLPRCGKCGAACREVHERLPARRWRDLPWGEHPVVLVYAPRRARCRKCDATYVEMLPWAEPKHRTTRRFEQSLAMEAASMPLSHVAIRHGLSWSTVRIAELAAIKRWQRTRPVVPLVWVGVDEKYLGRRHKRAEKFVTIVSNLHTGEPIWIGLGRREETLAAWIKTLSDQQKQQLVGFAMDMFEAFYAAVVNAPDLEHVAIVHDPFHVMKRVGEAIDEQRRSVFFRATPEMRAIGKGKRWLLLRAAERLTEKQTAEVAELLKLNRVLARAYQVKEEMRLILQSRNRQHMAIGLDHVLRRIQSKRHTALRKLHESIVYHREEILSLCEFHPPTGRIEALNNNWETLVRRSRGHRDLDYLLAKLAFITANPLRDAKDLRRFRALGRPAPMRHAA